MTFSENGMLCLLSFITINFEFSGRILALLDDSGSVSFFSAACMSYEEARLFILRENEFPENFLAHVNLIAKLNEQPRPQIKRYMKLKNQLALMSLENVT